MYESIALNNLVQDHVDRINAEKQARYEAKIMAERAQQAEENAVKKVALKWRELFYSMKESFDTLDKNYDVVLDKAVDRRLSTEAVKLIALEYGVPEEAFSEDNIAKKAKKRFEEWKTEKPDVHKLVKPEDLPCLNKKSCLSD